MSTLKRFFTEFNPENYQIFLDINRQDKIFKGETKITGNAKDSIIHLHQKNLDIKSVKVNQQAVDFKIDNKDDAIEIALPDPGNIIISIEYEAKLTDTMMGIYPSYFDVDGVQKQIIGTQFETTFARQAFPCVDEPEAKATFDLAIKFDEQPGETILSNMPEVREVNGIHYFEKTKKMSTYLVAFAFGELQKKETVTNSGVKVGVYATKAHAAKELNFALKIAKESIEFYEKFYDTPYPLPHSWQLALPDFSAGAMENWGLVTYREAYLLLDEDNTTLNRKQIVATVIAHELAHQWFGDLVTMKWWDDLWLNESFANMMEYVSIDAIRPEWKIWESFQATETNMALQRDAIDGVQSVHVNVNNPAEIDALFDGAIVYAKGARMLVMVRALIGDKALRKGLKNYFANHQYNNATGKDLWQALGDASGINVGEIMNSWLEQPGYPVVDAYVENGHLKLKQHQFFIGQAAASEKLWQIPLNSNYQKVDKIMNEWELDLGDYAELRSENKKPFMLNVGNNSHFIVHYSQDLLKDILEQLNDLNNIDQFALLQYWRLMGQANYQSFSETIKNLLLFNNHDSYLVNQALYQILNEMKHFVVNDDEATEALKQVFAKFSEKQYQKLTLLPQATDSNDDQMVRPIVINAALYGENTVAIKDAHELLEKYRDNLINIPADIRGLVLKNELINFNSHDFFEKLLNEYQTTSDAGFKSDLMQALTATKEPKQLQEIVDNYENAAVIKPQDLRGWFRGVLNNPVGQQMAWDWIRDDWQWLEDTVGGDMEFATYITVIAGIFKTSERLNEFKTFFNPKIDEPGLTREIVMDKKLINSRVQQIEKQKASIKKALEFIK